MAAAKALFKGIVECGTYIDPNTSAVKIDTKLSVCFVGVDSTTHDDIVQVILDFNDAPAQMQNAIKAAIVAQGATFGYTFSAGDVLFFSLVKA